MKLSARLALALVAVCLPAAGGAQVVLQPTPEPVVTAERTGWYLAGEPITYEGDVYYPVGAAAHFNRFEMVRSGAYRGVPLYIRTTIEPHSIVFVPLAGGVMQPYERRRDGAVAGTVGSTTPGLPVVVPTRGDSAGAGIQQAPMPPVVMGTTGEHENQLATAAGGSRLVPAVGTTGRAPSIPPPTPYEPLVKPRGLDAAFVDFKGERWFQKGSAVRLDQMRLIRIGDHHGFPVYAADAGADTIYIPVTREVVSLAAPYSKRR